MYLNDQESSINDETVSNGALAFINYVTQYRSVFQIFVSQSVPLKYTPFQSSVYCLLLSLNSTFRQGSCSNLVNLQDSISANHLWLGKFLKKKLVYPGLSFSKLCNHWFKPISCNNNYLFPHPTGIHVQKLPEVEILKPTSPTRD